MMRHVADRLVRDEDGASTVEFVVLLPFMIGLLGIIASASLYLALASDVQQLAHELARSALPVADEDDWCTQIEARMVEPLASNLPLLDPERVASVTCGIDPDSHLLQVAVNYDTRGTLGAILGSVIGLRIDSFQRSSFVQW